jgi:gluconokinase
MNPVIFIMGVSGSGKTTIGKLVAEATGLPFFDGDDFHTKQNTQKMKAGKVLTDEDRQPWLQNLQQLAIEQSGLKGAVIACSALKVNYRILLTNGVPHPLWIFLQGSYELIYQRMEQRSGHFMPAQLLRSQFDNLEIPENSFTVSVENKPEKITVQIMQYLQSF